MGALYPFSLAQKLAAITEVCDWYADGKASPWGRAIIPTEMVTEQDKDGNVREESVQPEHAPKLFTRYLFAVLELALILVLIASIMFLWQRYRSD